MIIIYIYCEYFVFVGKKKKIIKIKINKKKNK